MGKTEEEAEQLARDAEDAELGEAMDKYKGAIIAVANRLFSEHALTLEPIDDWRFKVVPTKSWKDALGNIVTTINGVDMFEFSGARELCSSGPWSPKEAVMGHLHWIADWPEVYGYGKARSMIDRALSCH